MHIRVISIGRIKQQFILAGEEEYLTRLKAWAKISVEELDVRENLPELQLKAREAQALQDKVKSDEFLVLLDEHGKTYDSPGFAKFIEKKSIDGISKFTFAIGGACGWDEEFKRGKALLSLSAMTFPYQLTRLILIEQLYRGLSIMKGMPYHKV